LTAHSQIIIEPGHTKRYFWRDLWRFRELFFVLAWRDIAVRYKQTVLGVGWGVLRPLVTMLVLTVIFSRVAKLPSESGAPYALLVFSGLLSWNLITVLFAESANSLLSSANIISKIYFPRLIIPVATSITALVDFLIGLIILCGMMIFYGFAPSWKIVLLPAFVLLAVCVGLGPGLLFASLNVKYRDLRNVLPFVVQIGLYVSPVGFSSAVISSDWRLAYSLNPAVGIIDGFRWCILGGTGDLYWPSVVISLVAAVGLLMIGLWRFRATERSFADLM
jgi:lipopolysaccharide transport system permease protein